MVFLKIGHFSWDITYFLTIPKVLAETSSQFWITADKQRQPNDSRTTANDSQRQPTTANNGQEQKQRPTTTANPNNKFKKQQQQQQQQHTDTDTDTDTDIASHPTKYRHRQIVLNRRQSSKVVMYQDSRGSCARWSLVCCSQWHRDRPVHFWSTGWLVPWMILMFKETHTL